MYTASENGHTEVVDLLVQAGADIHLATTAKVCVSTYILVEREREGTTYMLVHLSLSLVCVKHLHCNVTYITNEAWMI